jgi:hypothetical protein
MEAPSNSSFQMSFHPGNRSGAAVAAAVMASRTSVDFMWLPYWENLRFLAMEDVRRDGAQPCRVGGG